MNYINSRFSDSAGNSRDPLSEGMKLMGKPPNTSESTLIKPEDAETIAYTGDAAKAPVWKSPLDSIIQILPMPQQ